MKSLLFAFSALSIVSHAETKQVPQAIIDVASASIVKRCEGVAASELKLVASQVRKIEIDQGKNDYIYFLGFEVQNNTNDNDEDWIEAQIYDARIENPTANVIPETMALRVYGRTKCD